MYSKEDDGIDHYYLLVTEDAEVLTELPKSLHNRIMNLFSRHDRLGFIGDHKQNGTDGDGKQGDQDDGRERGDRLGGVRIGIQPCPKRS